MVTTAPAGSERAAPDRRRAATRHAAPPELGLGFRIGRLARALRRDWADELSGSELSPPQAVVLRGVEASPGCSLRALARTLGSDPMNVKRCVDELEARGLVTSAHRATDRRSRTLTLTQAGCKVAADVGTLVERHESWLAAALGTDGRGALEAAVGRLEVLLGLTAPDVAPTAAPPGTLESDAR